MIDTLKIKLFKDKSLRKTVFVLIITFTTLFAIAIAVISSLTLFNMKIENMSYNQKLFLKQVEYNTNMFISQIEHISSYLKLNYEKKDFIIQDIINVNPLIKTVLILDSNSNLKELHSKEKKKIFDIKRLVTQINSKKLKENQSIWSDLFISEVNNKSYVSYAFKNNDETIFMLVSLENLTLLTNGLVNSDDSFMIRIFDNKGNFILNQDRPDLVKEKFNAINTDIYTKLINIKNEYEMTKFKNICYGSMDYGMYSVLEKTGWKIVVRQNYDIVEEYLSNLIFSIVGTIMFFTLFAIYITRRFLKNIFNSLDKFEKQTSTIASGDYQQNLEPIYFTEFNNLSSSIIKMKNKIELREENLKDSLNNFKTLINSTMEGIIIHDERVCLDINDVALKILGYKNKDDIIGKDIYKHVSMKYKKDAINYFQKNSFFSKPREYELVTNDNRIITVLAKGRIIKNANKSFRISAFLDITNIKNQQKILLQQSRMASVGEMLSNIAHQWRQPLSAIRTISSGIKLEKELGLFSEEKLIKSLDLINENTAYLSKIIDEFSTYFNPNKEIEVFDLISIIGKTLTFIEPTLKSNDIKIVAKFDDEIFIKGYPSELSQALINIFNNSKEALILNNIKEKIILISSYKEKNKAVITIKDSALGINNSILPKIFEPYFTTKHKAKGIGIGLYMTHQIVTEHMNGMIYARNTTFDFENKSYKGLEIILEFNL